MWILLPKDCGLYLQGTGTNQVAIKSSLIYDSAPAAPSRPCLCRPKAGTLSPTTVSTLGALTLRLEVLVILHVSHLALADFPIEMAIAFSVKFECVSNVTIQALERESKKRKSNAF